MSKVRTSTLINRIEETTSKYRIDKDTIYTEYYYCKMTRENVIHLAGSLDLVAEHELAPYEYKKMCNMMSN